MFYFNTIKITNPDPDKVERSIRDVSLKRHVSLDLKTSVSYVREEQKRFLAKEGNKHLRLTRIRSPFELFFPKLIIRFDKKDFSRLQIRLGLASTLIAFILLTTFILNVFYAIKAGQFENDFYTVLVLTGIFVALTFLEYQLTKRQITKSLSGFKQGKITEQLKR